MGFNLIRFALDPQYRAIKRWKRDKGDERLLLDVPLDGNSLVIDAGFYRGSFATRASARGCGRVLAFEPAPEFCEAARELVDRLGNVELECAGLSGFNGTAELVYDNDGSSTQRGIEGRRVEIRLRRASEVVSQAGQDIDLLKLNIEGDEYPVLEDLIETGTIARVRTMMVQFHLIDDTSRDRYEAIADTLRKTHVLTWRYPFIWERWDRKPA
jgi:FkbM family methyltransferase